MFKMIKRFWNDWSGKAVATKEVVVILEQIVVGAFSVWLVGTASIPAIVALLIFIIFLAITFLNVVFVGFILKKYDEWKSIKFGGDSKNLPPGGGINEKKLLQESMRELDDYLSEKTLAKEIEALVRKSGLAICTALSFERGFVTISV